MTGLIDAVTLLTRVPLGAGVHDESRIARAVPWFPIVGALIGAATAGVYALGLFVFPPLLAASLAIAFGWLITGAIHEDGLADLADAVGGGRDREDRLRILKDPRLGSYGVLALIGTTLIRVAAIASLGRTAALFAIPAAHALSRATSVGAMTTFAPLDTGLGASYARHLTSGRAAFGIAAGVLIAVGLVRIWVVPEVVLAIFVVAALGRLATRKLGGINGDVLGAIQQVVELSALAVAVVAVRRGFAF